MLFANEECRSYFGIELPSFSVKKKSFCYGITVRKICFVDTVVSCDFFVIFFLFLLFNVICLPLLLVNKR